MSRSPVAPLFAWMFALVAAPALAAPPAGPPADRTLARAIDAYLAPLVRIDAFQGAVLVTRSGRVRVARGYGWADVELAVPNTPARSFRIASLSKPFTQVALGSLVDAGRLRLSDPLSRFLPDFPHGDSITLDQLRTHRAGVPGLNSLPYDEEASAPTTLDSLVAALGRRPLDFPPGSKRRYSNGGYALLAAVIERASGMSYAAYLDSAVLRPLGLAHTRSEGDGELVPGRALGYATDPRHARGLIPGDYQQMATKPGGGSLVSTVMDVDAFLRAIHHAPLLHAETWNALFPPDTAFAFQGRCPGFNSYALRDEAHDVDVVVLANDYSAGMIGEIGDDLMALARGNAVTPAAWRADLAPTTEDDDLLTGAWRAAESGLPMGTDPVEVVRDHGSLVAMRAGAPVDVLLPQGHGVYLLRALWSKVMVAPDATGVRVTMQPLWYAHAPVPLVRVTDPK